jgi:hemolysin activation/secretion protein
MIKLIFYGLVIYLVYKLVFELIIPVSKATAQMNEKVRQMQQQQQNFQQQQAKQAAEPQKAAKPSSDTDYIDYEEVKPS